MESLVAWFSLYGNTETLAREVSQVLSGLGPVRTMRLEEVLAGDLVVELAVFATPTHGFGIPPQVRPMLSRLPDGTLGGVKVAAFDTAFGWWPLSALTAAPKLLRRMRRLGGTPVAPAESFHVVATEGPLAEGELARARSWAEGIVAAVAPAPRTEPRPATTGTGRRTEAAGQRGEASGQRPPEAHRPTR